MPSASRPSVYSEVGAYVVDTSDVLIALWNGQPGHGPGGTAEVVKRAVRMGMPRVVISTSEPYAVDAQGLDRDWEPFRGLDRFNSTKVGNFEPSVGLERPSPSPPSPTVRATVDRVRRWIGPYFARADGLAARYQRRFVLAGRSMSMLAALAVATVAAQAAFFPRRDRLAWIEVALMVGVLVLWLRTRGRLHASWLSHRFLAERLRAAAYLALLGFERFPGETPTGAYRGSPTQEWITRAFREVWRLRPSCEPDQSDVADLAAIVRASWLDDQVGYYERRGIYHRRAQRTGFTASVALFAATAVAATLHAVGVGEGATLGKWLVFSSIVLPVFGAAVSWVSALEEHRRFGEQFESMVRRLRTLGEWLDQAGDLARLRELASQIDAELRMEAGEWVDVMRYNDVELPS
jgi:hypothetical protein